MLETFTFGCKQTTNITSNSGYFKNFLKTLFSLAKHNIVFRAKQTETLNEIIYVMTNVPYFKGFPTKRFNA